jgi:hypothetical protein
MSTYVVYAVLDSPGSEAEPIMRRSFETRDKADGCLVAMSLVPNPGAPTPGIMLFSHISSATDMDSR